MVKKGEGEMKMRGERKGFEGKKKVQRGQIMVRGKIGGKVKVNRGEKIEGRGEIGGNKKVNGKIEGE